MKYKLLLLSIFLTALSSCQTPTELPPIHRLEVRQTQPPEMEMVRLARTVAERLTDSHFRIIPLTDTLSAQIFDAYLDDLDPQRILLTQADIETLAPYRTRIDDQLGKNGALSFPLIAHEIAERRAEEYLLFATDFLARNPDCETGGDYQPDRRFSERPSDSEAQRNLWADALRYEVLTLRAQDRLDDENILPKNRPKTPPYQRSLSESERVTLKLLRSTHTLRNAPPRHAVNRLLNVYAKRFDPHSGFQAPEVFSQRIGRFNRSLIGLGIDFLYDEGLIRISRVHKHSNAERAGLQVNDIILSITDSGMSPFTPRGFTLDEIKVLLNGDPALPKTMLIAPANYPDSPLRTVVVNYRKLAPAANRPDVTSRVERVKRPNGETARICIVTLPSFYTKSREKNNIIGSASEVRDAILKHSKDSPVDAIILDLRKNGGGYVDEAIRLANLFIPAGPVFQRARRDGVVPMRCKDTAPLFTQPLLIMTSRSTASASEIFAAAMQDHGRAIIIGDHSTYGKGTVQENVNLSREASRHGLPNPAGGLYYTSTKSYRLTGDAINIHGIIPDIILPSTTDSKVIGEYRYPNHIPFDTINAAKFAPSSDSRLRCLPELKKRSARRVAAHMTLSQFLTNDSFRKPTVPEIKAAASYKLTLGAIHQRLKDARVKDSQSSDPAQAKLANAVDKAQVSEAVNILRDLLSMPQ